MIKRDERSKPFTKRQNYSRKIQRCKLVENSLPSNSTTPVTCRATTQKTVSKPEKPKWQMVEGATKNDNERLPKYKFRRIGDFEKQNGEIQEAFGGIMIEFDTDSPIEHVLPQEDGECCICLSAYDDGSELRESPCCHHFHFACIDKWIYVNATFPLCMFNILKNGSSQSSSEEA